jgi:hypothetical protein
MHSDQGQELSRVFGNGDLAEKGSLATRAVQAQYTDISVASWVGHRRRKAPSLRASTDGAEGGRSSDAHAA